MTIDDEAVILSKLFILNRNDKIEIIDCYSVVILINDYSSSFDLNIFCISHIIIFVDLYVMYLFEIVERHANQSDHLLIICNVNKIFDSF